MAVMLYAARSKSTYTFQGEKYYIFLITKCSLERRKSGCTSKKVVLPGRWRVFSTIMVKQGYVGYEYNTLTFQSEHVS